MGSRRLATAYASKLLRPGKTTCLILRWLSGGLCATCILAIATTLAPRMLSHLEGAHQKARNENDRPPKRTNMPQRNRHDPLARDANLRKVQRATALTFAGGVVLTGGFYAAGAQAFSGVAHKISPATVVGNVDGATGTQGSITAPAPPDQTSPLVVAPQSTAHTTAEAPIVAQRAPTTIPSTTATATISIAPPLQPLTLPHKKKPYSQPAPVVSGGS